MLPSRVAPLGLSLLMKRVCLSLSSLAIMWMSFGDALLTVIVQAEGSFCSILVNGEGQLAGCWQP